MSLQHSSASFRRFFFSRGGLTRFGLGAMFLFTAHLAQAGDEEGSQLEQSSEELREESKNEGALEQEVDESVTAELTESSNESLKEQPNAAAEAPEVAEDVKMVGNASGPDLADKMEAAEKERANAAVLLPEVPSFRVEFRSVPLGTRIFLGENLPKADGYTPGAWQERLEADEFMQVCEAPCQRRIYPGEYRFALAPAEGGPVAAREVLSIHADTLVEGKYRSMRVRRIAGWVTAAASLVGGAAMMFLGVNGCDGSDGSCVQENPLVWAGAGVFLLGLPTGIWLTLSDDQVSFSAQ
ncbi:MAG: hypothetical protein MK135_07270 [Polyangiaceae bacterium]|nr:hypothetical protein [Polyangiaceae bacterium]